MATTVNKKINHIFLLLERLAKGEELYSKNPVILEEFGVDERTMYRYLKDIHDLYGHMVITEKKIKEFTDKKVTVYRVIDKKKDVSEIFRFFIHNSVDLSWLLQLVRDNDPTLLDDTQNKELLKNSIKQDDNVFFFQNSPFEFLNEKQNKLFSKAKMAVRHHEYRCITYHYHEEEILENIKCLKLVFMSNNWYLAIEDSAQTLRFLRFCFIKAINYSKKNNSFQRCVLDRYVHFFHRLQNPMTLNIDPQTAYLRASKHIAVYFRTSMKPFFPSQKFLRHNDDGSIDFSLAFTQNIEILPFIKQWQPHLVVLSPDALKEELLNDMRQSLDNH